MPAARRAAQRVSVLALAVLLAALPAAGLAAESRAMLGGVETVVWTPDEQGATRWPVAVFSHGFLMCPTQARFIARALAASGYLVVAPFHADSYCGDLSVDLANASRLPLKPSMLWSDADYRDRASDVHAVLDGLRTDSSIGVLADAGRVALIGHSLGGYTVLGLGGAWPSWGLAGVRAIVAYVPYVMPYLGGDALSRLRAPVMFQGGTQDPAFTVPLWMDGGAYERASRPKYLVEIEGATHLAWTDLGISGREAIVASTVAFLDRYVKDAPETAALLSRIDGVAELRRDPPLQPLRSVAGEPRGAMGYAAAAAMVRGWLSRAREWLPELR